MTEKQLIKGLRKGERKCFDELFELYYDTCHSYAMSLLKNIEAVDDVLQNIFLKLWMNRNKLDPHRPLKNYLVTAVRNESVSYLRLKYNTARSGTEIPEVVSDAPDVESMMSYSETMSRMQAIIDAMPPQRRRVLEMRRNEDLSAKEIAQKLDLSVRTVERHLALAMKELRNGIS